ncbi:MAG: hypothetical protein AB8B47_11485 [Roseobacter sp.]
MFDMSPMTVAIGVVAALAYVLGRIKRSGGGEGGSSGWFDGDGCDGGGD